MVRMSRHWLSADRQHGSTLLVDRGPDHDPLVRQHNDNDTSSGPGPAHITQARRKYDVGSTDAADFLHYSNRLPI